MGVPGMYAVEDFVILDSDLGGMVMCENPCGWVITHRLIADSGIGNINGFWGAVFEDGDAWACDLVRKAVADLCGRAGMDVNFDILDE